MAINALLSPTLAPKAAESGPAKTPNDAEKGFADVLAQTVGKTPDDAGAPSATASTSAPTTPSPTVPEAPLSLTVPATAVVVEAIKMPTADVFSLQPPSAGETVEAPAAVDAPKAGVSTAHAATAKKGATRGRPVEAPPDPPPTKTAPEAGAPTPAPNALVERPDPTSGSEPTQDAVPTMPAPDPTVSTVPLSVLTIAQMPIAVKTNASASSTAVAAAVASSIDAKGQPLSPSLADPLASQNAKAVEGPTSEPVGAVSTRPSLEMADSATRPTPPVAESVRLPQAPDLVQTPPVVQAVVAASTEAVHAVASVPNARVARVATVPEATAVKPTEPSVRPAPIMGNAVPVAGATASTGDDSPSEDAPKQDAQPEPAFQPTVAPVRSAATERPEAGMGRAEIDRHLVVRQVADRIESLVASRPKDGLVVHLEPRDLGTVTLVVKGLQSALDVQVTASDERVRQSLDSARPELAQALAPRGIELRELRVATASSTTAMGSNAGGGSAPNPEGRARPQAQTSTFAKSSRAEPSAPRTTRTRSNGRGVDLLV